MRIRINEKYQLLLFMLFWFFTIIGSNLYIGSTMLSIRNLLYPLLFLLIYSLRTYSLNKIQKTLFTPLALLFLYSSILLITHGLDDLEAIKDYFYFSFIPVLFISVILLSNRLNDDFFNKIKQFALFLLFFLFVVTIFEFNTNIHLPVHAFNRYHIPSAFFTNANDLSVIVIQLFSIITVLKNKADSKWQYITAFLMTTIIVFLTLSRLAVFAYILISISIVFSKHYTWKDISFNILIIVSILVYLSIGIPTPQSSTTVVDRSKTRINSITEFNKLEGEDSYYDIQEGDTLVSSTRVRLDIYKIPLNNPDKFIFGHGFNSDKEVITQYKTLPYHIINSHSFFIQLVFYFGWIGLGIIGFFFSAIIYFSIVNYKELSFLIPATIVHILVLNIPSSVMRFPLVWIPFFITIAYYTQNKFKKGI